MSDALLDKARAILAHAKQIPYPMANAKEAEEKSPMTEPTVPFFSREVVLPSQATLAIQNVEIQPAASNAKAIYWETGTGTILGPAVPEFLGRDGNSYWISMTFEGQIWWVNADRLRSRRAFDGQIKTKRR